MSAEKTNCPACIEHRCHTEEEWKNHPYRCHGFNGTAWTHPDLAAEAAAKGKPKGVVEIVLKTKGAGGA